MKISILQNNVLKFDEKFLEFGTCWLSLAKKS